MKKNDLNYEVYCDDKIQKKSKKNNLDYNIVLLTIPAFIYIHWKASFSL